MNKKKFDCVEMKHRAALRIHEETKSMTDKEKLAYWSDAYNKMIKKRKTAGVQGAKRR